MDIYLGVEKQTGGLVDTNDDVEEKEREADALLDSINNKIRAIRFCVECIMQKVNDGN